VGGLRGRRSGDRARRLSRLGRGLVLPEEELRPYVEVKSGLHHLDEGFAVNLVKCEGGGEARDERGEQKRKNNLQVDKEHDAEPARASDVDKLPQRERPHNLILNFNKLGYLILHPPHYSSRNS